MKMNMDVEVYLNHSWLRHYTEVSGQLHASAVLHPGNSPPLPICSRLGGTQSLWGRYGREKNLLSLPGTEPCCSACSLVAIPTDGKSNEKLHVDSVNGETITY
jgi:hypothetical protein